MRPIGAPDIKSKILWGAQESILRKVLEREISENQHGFMTGRGCTTALLSLRDQILANKAVFSYDLSSFFNMINVRAICGQINNRVRGLGQYILAGTLTTITEFAEG